MHRVLIAGGGVGGLAAAHRLRELLPDDDEVVVFDARADHTFWPSLLWVMTGSRHAEDVVRPLTALRDRRIRIVTEAVEQIDPAARSLTAGGRTWTGDALIVALGAALDPGQIPGLEDVPGNVYTVAGATAVWQQLQALDHGRLVVVIARVPFKCPAAPYEAAMLMDGYLRRRRRRDRVAVELWAAEAAPMSVAGPAVSQAVVSALTERGIAYHPGQAVSAVEPAAHRAVFGDHTPVSYDLLAYVPPHRVPPVVAAAGLAPADGWVAVDRGTMETRFPHVFAIGDVTGVPLTVGKPLPKAGVFAHRQGEVVAAIIAARLAGERAAVRFDGAGECFIEMGRGVAGFARGNFYAEPAPTVRPYRPGRHWHAGKLAFERHWWAQWW